MKAQTAMSNKSIQRFFLPTVTHPWLEFPRQKKLIPSKVLVFSSTEQSCPSHQPHPALTFGTQPYTRGI